MFRPRTLFFALILCAAQLCFARDLAIVVNKSNSTSTISAADLEKLLKLGVPSWPDGKKVKIFLTDPGSAESRTTLQRAYKITPAEIKALADAHKADIQIVTSDDIVLTMIDNHPGGIGVVNVYSINSQVKVLKIDGKLPMEPGYLLHGN
jgi:ABC-type phosphate transport system substrate-binding protein